MSRLVCVFYSIVNMIATRGFFNLIIKVPAVFRREGLRGVALRLFHWVPQKSYTKWINAYSQIELNEKEQASKSIALMTLRPKISILMPVYDPPLNLLDEAIRSVLSQWYDNWELCIADDASKNEEVRSLLAKHAFADSRIKVVCREVNGHISIASNSALELASGDFIALMDHDDVIADCALYWVARYINKHPNASVFYSDEDKIDIAGKRSDPYFKSDWNPYLFLCQNFVSHFGVYRGKLIKSIGGFRRGFEGSQDYDLTLRCVERIKDNDVIHIPHILYHWRLTPGSTAISVDSKSYARCAAKRAVSEYLVRNNISALVSLCEKSPGQRVTFLMDKKLPVVSIIIPTRDRCDLVEKCVNSIFEKTSYPCYEIIIVDNGSTDSEILEYFTLISGDARVRVIRDDGVFNYSAINNRAAKYATGSILAFLNDDVEVISPDWLYHMVSLADQGNVGAVGAMLLYPNNLVQHAGVVLGGVGVAGHAHKYFRRDSSGYFGRLLYLQSYTAVTGACLVVNSKKFFDVNGFNEKELAVAFNDVDFCLKLREAGYWNVWTPDAKLYHHESASRGHDDTKEKQARFQVELSYMNNRWPEWIDSDPAYNSNLSLELIDFSLADVSRIKVL